MQQIFVTFYWSVQFIDFYIHYVEIDGPIFPTVISLHVLCVSKIVALITVPDSVRACAHVFFMRLKPYFKVCALIFYVCEGSSQAIANQLNMQKIMVSIFFDYEGLDLWHTR